jgi:type IV secretory pathway TraG/TraD family ATPase VirD4
MARTTKIICAAAAGLVLSVALWTVLASALSLWILGQLDYFQPPYWQWWQIRPYWVLNWYEALAIWGGAIIAALPFAPVPFIFTARRRREGKNNETLYGNTRWASHAELDEGGFRERRTLQ